MLASRYLPWTVLVTGGGLLLALWTTGALRTAPVVSPSGPGPGKSMAQRAGHTSEKHYVGPRQLAESNAMVSRLVDGFEVTGHDGRRLRWHDLSAGQPVVLIFIKDGCPCSVQVEPFFQRVESLYHDAVRFASVINAGVEAARRYAREQGVSHPVLADPERQLIRRFKVKNACYVVLLTADSMIDGFWPGCSVDTMQQLSQRIARLVGVNERWLDVSGMPGPLTTGCPF